jgi:hypothetical protein
MERCLVRIGSQVYARMGPISYLYVRVGLDAARIGRHDGSWQLRTRACTWSPGHVGSEW